MANAAKQETETARGVNKIALKEAEVDTETLQKQIDLWFRGGFVDHENWQEISADGLSVFNVGGFCRPVEVWVAKGVMDEGGIKVDRKSGKHRLVLKYTDGKSAETGHSFETEVEVNRDFGSVRETNSFMNRGEEVAVSSGLLVSVVNSRQCWDDVVTIDKVGRIIVLAGCIGRPHRARQVTAVMELKEE
jgi:hypothetical protein